MTSIEDCWTADFKEFKAKVEGVFGRIEKMPDDIYAHQVCSHGFMEYVCMSGTHGKLRQSVLHIMRPSNDDEVIDEEKFLLKHGDEFRTELDRLLKVEYLKWAKVNNIRESVVEIGWATFLAD